MNFFILGNPRSGTTLLRLMLNAHPQMGVPPESGFLEWWYEKYKDWTIYDSSDSDKLNFFLNDLLGSKKIETWHLDRQELRGFIEKKKPENYLDLISLIYGFYCDNKPIIGDKNNYYINILDKVYKIAPAAKYIHLVRDGRDVACSYKAIQSLDSSLSYLPKVPFDIQDIAKEWNSNVLKVERFIAHKSSITIKYEDLIDYPATELKKICEFLGVSFHEEMLSYYEPEHNNEPEETMSWKKKTLETVDSGNKNKYKNLLQAGEILTFNTLAREGLNHFGYDR